MSAKGSDTKDVISEWWREHTLEKLIKESKWLRVFDQYHVPQPWYRRLYNWLHWHTIGRFRAWLHRDCGDY